MTSNNAQLIAEETFVNTVTMPEESWGKVFQPYAESVARQGRTVSLDTRLLLAAIGRANNTGHAVFKEGELRQILAKPQADGTCKPVSRSTVYATLGKLRQAGLVLPGGGETCVWLPRELWSRNVKRGTICRVHRTWGPAYASEEIGQNAV